MNKPLTLNYAYCRPVQLVYTIEKLPDQTRMELLWSADQARLSIIHQTLYSSVS